jgi:hypothetical protein
VPNPPAKKEAARSIIPGKNPKTQRDVQSGRLDCRDADTLNNPIDFCQPVFKLFHFWAKFGVTEIVR